MVNPSWVRVEGVECSLFDQSRIAIGWHCGWGDGKTFHYHIPPPARRQGGEVSNCVCGKLTVGGTDHCFIHDPDEGRWMSKATFGAVHEMTEACTTNCRPVWVKHPTINASAPGAESGREK